MSLRCGGSDHYFGRIFKKLCPKAAKGLAQSLHKLFFVIPQMPEKSIFSIPFQLPRLGEGNFHYKQIALFRSIARHSYFFCLKTIRVPLTPKGNHVELSKTAVYLAPPLGRYRRDNRFLFSIEKIAEKPVATHVYYRLILRHSVHGFRSLYASAPPYWGVARSLCSIGAYLAF